MDTPKQQDTITSFPEKMNRLRRTAQKDGKEIEYWSAREISAEFGYPIWVHFEAVIQRAILNCSKVNVTPKNHFALINKMVPIGSGAHREQLDYVLSRTACYLIALNGDPLKSQISWAKAYFIVQTQIQESQPLQLSKTAERLQLREKLKAANKMLGGAAKEAGVDNFGFFHAAGIRSLYNMTMAELKAKKGIRQSDDYWDRVCAFELSSNEFKAQLAKKTIEQKKKTGEISGQKQAEKEHERIGNMVRTTIYNETRIHLENLPPEPSLKKLLGEEKKAAKLKRKAEKLSANTKPLSLPPASAPPPPV